MKSFKVPLKFGILTSLILIVYFLVLGFNDANANPAYSAFNIVITASGIALAIKSVKQANSGEIDYKSGLETGFFTGVIATVIFSIFFISYYVYVPEFSEKLLDKVGDYASTGGVFATVVLMGVASSIVVSFALMQLHKKPMYSNSKSKKSKINS